MNSPLLYFADGKTNDVKNRLNKANEILNNYNENLADMSVDDLSDTLHLLEKSALLIRRGMYDKQEKNVYYYPENYNIYDKNLPVDIEFNKGILTIKTPFLYRRIGNKYNKSYNYIFVNYVIIALEKWINDNGNLYKKIEMPSVMIIKRKAKKYNHSLHCDNDNAESSRIINTIFDAIGHSDNVKNMDLYTCFRESEDEGMEFILMSQKQFRNNLEILK